MLNAVTVNANAWWAAAAAVATPPLLGPIYLWKVSFRVLLEVHFSSSSSQRPPSSPLELCIPISLFFLVHISSHPLSLSLSFGRDIPWMLQWKYLPYLSTRNVNIFSGLLFLFFGDFFRPSHRMEMMIFPLCFFLPFVVAKKTFYAIWWKKRNFYKMLSFLLPFFWLDLHFTWDEGKSDKNCKNSLKGRHFVSIKLFMFGPFIVVVVAAWTQWTMVVFEVRNKEKRDIYRERESLRKQIKYL